MKKILLLSAILLSVTACKDKATQKDPIENSIAYQEVQAETSSDYEKAKATLDEMFLHAESMKKGEISEDKHAALAYPLGQKYNVQKAALNDEDRQLLKIYSNKRFDEVYPEEDRQSQKVNIGKQTLDQIRTHMPNRIMELIERGDVTFFEDGKEISGPEALTLAKKVRDGERDMILTKITGSKTPTMRANIRSITINEDYSFSLKYEESYPGRTTFK